MTERALQAGCLLVGLLLLALALYPPSFVGFFAHGPGYQTTVAPEGTDAYQQELSDVEEAGGSAEDLRVVDYESLSPEAQRFVDRALERPADRDGAHSYSPRVCAPYAVACPGLASDAVPPELTYEVHSPIDEVAMFVERGDARYLVTTSGLVAGAVDPAPVGPLLFAAIRLALLVPLGGVLVALGAGSITSIGRGRSDAGVLASIRRWLADVDLLARIGRRLADVEVRARVGSLSADRRSDVLVGGYGVLVALLALWAGIDWLALVWILPWLVPGLLAKPTSDARLLSAGVALGAVQAAVAVLTVYLAAYGGPDVSGEVRLQAGLLVGWCGALVLAVAALWTARTGREGDDSSEPAA